MTRWDNLASYILKKLDTLFWSIILMPLDLFWTGTNSVTWHTLTCSLQSSKSTRMVSLFPSNIYWQFSWFPVHDNIIASVTCLIILKLMCNTWQYIHIIPLHKKGKWMWTHTDAPLCQHNYGDDLKRKWVSKELTQTKQPEVLLFLYVAAHVKSLKN